MNIDRAEELAQAARTPLEASRLYNDVEYELAMSVDNEDQYEAGERALAILRDRFPDVEDAARQITDPPKASRGAWKTIHADPDPIDEPDEAPIVVFVPRPRRRRPIRNALLGAAALGVVAFWVQIGTAPSACPSGTSFDTSVLMDYCQAPDGHTVCDISAFGFSPNPNDVPSGTVYAKTGPDGPWCPNALPPK